MVTLALNAPGGDSAEIFSGKQPYEISLCLIEYFPFPCIFKERCSQVTAPKRSAASGNERRLRCLVNFLSELLGNLFVINKSFGGINEKD
jgi:hypothetical protein